MTNPPLRCHPCTLEPPERYEKEAERLGRPIERLVRQRERAVEGLTMINGTLTCLHHARELERERIARESSEQERARRRLDAERSWRGR